MTDRQPTTLVEAAKARAEVHPGAPGVGAAVAFFAQHCFGLSGWLNGTIAGENQRGLLRSR